MWRVNVLTRETEQAESANTLSESEEGVLLGVQAGIADILATGSQGSAYLPKFVCPPACSRRGIGLLLLLTYPSQY